MISKFYDQQTVKGEVILVPYVWIYKKYVAQFNCVQHLHIFQQCYYSDAHGLSLFTWLWKWILLQPHQIPRSFLVHIVCHSLFCKVCLLDSLWLQRWKHSFFPSKERASFTEGPLGGIRKSLLDLSSASRRRGEGDSDLPAFVVFPRFLQLRIVSMSRYHYFGAVP